MVVAETCRDAGQRRRRLEPVDELSVRAQLTGGSGDRPDHLGIAVTLSDLPEVCSGLLPRHGVKKVASAGQKHRGAFLEVLDFAREDPVGVTVGVQAFVDLEESSWPAAKGCDAADGFDVVPLGWSAIRRLDAEVCRVPDEPVAGDGKVIAPFLDQGLGLDGPGRKRECKLEAAGKTNRSSHVNPPTGPGSDCALAL